MTAGIRRIGHRLAATHLVRTTHWTSADVAGIEAHRSEAPLIGDRHVVPVSPELGFWDAWPLQLPEGPVAPLKNGATLWMALGARRFSDPSDRHHHARIHLVLRDAKGWRHLGPAMPDGFSPGSREWSGSAVLKGNAVTLYFTAAGHRGESLRTFEQRLFSAGATIVEDAGTARLEDWRDLHEIVRPDAQKYELTAAALPSPIGLKAFRDPAYFVDPLTGGEYLFFAGSLAHSGSDFNGAVGAAIKASGGDWELLPPLISAEGLNNELERPHAIWHNGHYYLFWSTQRHVFDPTRAAGPTGLYGMVSESLLSGWTPLNGTGLVFANPAEAPSQAYAWLVLPDLCVTSFVDQWGAAEVTDEQARFGGTFAPFLRLRLAGSRAELVR